LSGKSAQAVSSQSKKPKRAPVRRRRIAGIAASVVLSILSLWSLAAIAMDLRPGWLKAVALMGYVSALGALWLWKNGGAYRFVCGVALPAVIVAWWLRLTPKADQDWAPEFGRAPWAEQTGDRVVIHDVRNFTYRTEHDFTPHWEIRTYDLSHVVGADLFLIRWGAPLIAHTIVSFRFDDGTYLATSIEARRTQTQEYSALRGFFRQFQISYLVADERDVVRLRTNYRKDENAYLYRTRLTPVDARGLLEAYLGWMNAAHARPEWYNALTKNCSTPMIAYLAKARIGGISRWDGRGILDGSGDKMLYELGDLAGDQLPFEQLKRQAWINPVAQKAGDDARFSEAIRAGRAGFGP
jgi:hypothetical protein